MAKLLRFPQPQSLLDMALAAHPIHILPSAEPDAVGLFVSYMRRERSTSDNALIDYLADVEMFQEWLAVRGKCLEQAKRKDIRAFIAARLAEGLSHRSAAKKASTLHCLVDKLEGK